jgi:hypothetical protein
MSANPLELFPAYPGPRKPAVLDIDRDVERRSERRGRIRTTVHWPVRFFRNHTGEAVETLTQDLSSGGFYCLSPTPFVLGERLVCVLRVPTHRPGGKEADQTLECKVQVMRVDPAVQEEFYGIACRIEDYRFAPMHSAPAAH